MTNVTALRPEPDRLARVRAAERAVAETIEAHTASAARVADATGPDGTVDPRVVHEHRIAIQVREAAVHELGQAIMATVGDRGFEEGDQVLSPYSMTVLTVAETRWPDGPQPELGEITLTPDGLYVEGVLHTWPDGHAYADRSDPVPFERWWFAGLRTAGHCHPQTRRIVYPDPPAH